MLSDLLARIDDYMVSWDGPLQSETEELLRAARAALVAQQDAARTNASMLARQCDLAREAELKAKQAESQLCAAEAALAQMQHCVSCDMDWRGPYGECPGCQAQAGMLAVSQQAHEIAAHERRITELTEARNTVLRRLTEAEAKLRRIAAHDGNRHVWNDVDSPVSQDTPQEIAQAALKELTK